MQATKPQKSAIFRVWHDPCKVSGIPRMTPGNTENANRRLPMYANETANRFFAAAFSVVISAAFFAFAIIPASPSLVA